MAYRVELCPNNRAGCKNKECKDAGIKILKGQLRFATFVTTPDFQSWSYKHWGCVTPKQVINLRSSIDGDPDNLDGFEDLPEDYQEKIKKALEEGHVADADWSGDVEMNRAGKNGFRTPETKKAKRDAAKAKEEGSASPSKAPGKKRGRVKDDPDAEGDGPPTKKKKASVKKEKAIKGEDAHEAIEDEAKAAKRGRKKATNVKSEVKASIKQEDLEGQDDGAAPLPPAKQARVPRKSAAATKVKDEKSHASRERAEQNQSPPPKKTRAPRKAAMATKIKDEETDDGMLIKSHESPPLARRTRAPRTSAAKQKVRTEEIEDAPDETSDVAISAVTKKSKAPRKKASSNKVKKQEEDDNGVGDVSVEPAEQEPRSEADAEAGAEAEPRPNPKPKKGRKKVTKKTVKGKKSNTVD